MPRPKKCRRVCCLPDNSKFGPLDVENDENNHIIMAVDEYETIRLIDFEGLNQEECSLRMNVARTTVQAIYNNARKKLAEFLVNGKVLHIAGGEYQLCNETIKPCGKSCCSEAKCKQNIL